MTNEFTDDYVKDIGPGMLDGQTSKLYSNGTFVLREYISNSIDARAQNVHIKCKSPYDAIEISDDGKGFSKNNLRTILGFLVGYYVDLEEQRFFPPIGKFGIGLYAGGSICDTIEVKTTMKNSKELLHLLIPFSEWNELKNMRGKDRKYSLFEITKYRWRMEEKEEYYLKQGTTVILHGINENIRKQMKSYFKRKLTKKTRN